MIPSRYNSVKQRQILRWIQLNSSIRQASLPSSSSALHTVSTNTHKLDYNSTIYKSLSTFSRTSPLQSKDDNDSVLLYKRESSNFLPKVGLRLAMAHNLYWVWYVIDFMPTIHATMQPEMVDNTIGIVGLVTATVMNCGAMLYPKSLISEIRMKPKAQTKSVSSSSASKGQQQDHQNLQQQPNIIVKTHTLFLNPSKPKEYEHGQVVLDSPDDVTKIFSAFQGDMKGYSGYLPVHAEGLYINLLLHLNPKDAPNEIIHQDLLLSMLVPSKVIGSSLRTKSKQNGSVTGKEGLSLAHVKDKKLSRKWRRKNNRG